MKHLVGSSLGLTRVSHRKVKLLLLSHSPRDEISDGVGNKNGRLNSQYLVHMIDGEASLTKMFPSTVTGRNAAPWGFQKKNQDFFFPSCSESCCFPATSSTWLNREGIAEGLNLVAVTHRGFTPSYRTVQRREEFSTAKRGESQGRGE